MATTVYYGNGEVSVDGNQIRGVQLTYRGAIEITDKTPPTFSISANKSTILIFPMGVGYLDLLFRYVGELKITSALVASDSGKEHTIIKRVMDYSELIDVKSEDLDVRSEDLNSSHLSGRSINKTNLKQKIIPNLNTTAQKTTLWTANNELYTGDFHVHLDTKKVMSGSIHNRYSVTLYYKREGEDKLLELKDISKLATSTARSGITRSTDSGQATRARQASSPAYNPFPDLP